MQVVEWLKFKLWQCIFYPYYHILYFMKRKICTKLHIVNSEKTVKYIIKHQCSVSRFGDGEISLAIHLKRQGNENNYHVDSFQKFDKDLAQRLLDILKVQNAVDNHIVCIPYDIVKPQAVGYNRIYWKRFFVKVCIPNIDIFNLNYSYFDATFTRFYMGKSVKWKSNLSSYILLLKKIWEGQDICFVEGMNSRLGVGNDLFDNARSIKRILVPPTNAFSKYQEILKAAMSAPASLYLLAIGHTATVLAYDLAKARKWAIDVGHIDIEYEWLRMKAIHKMPVPFKYVNEVQCGRVITAYHPDTKYKYQIHHIVR